jgi:ring-1,2-phenylacetyl-CoA epoxidase subunit PaaD
VVTAERLAPPRAPIPESIVWSALHDVADPEIPAISVVDLGVIGGVESSPDRIRVEILPTFVGCPAIEVMREAIAARLAPMAGDVEVAVSFAEPWTSDRITPEGRRRLAASGFGPPVADDGEPGQIIQLAPAVPCPFCGSRRTTLENAFGPTLCRSIYYCAGCRQPFEQFKVL